jgi:hypothetical protein
MKGVTVLKVLIVSTPHSHAVLKIEDTAGNLPKLNNVISR